MGTSGFSDLAKPSKPYDLQDRRLAVDGNNLLHQALTGQRGADGGPLRSPDGRLTGHIVGLLKRHREFLRRGAHPVYVFDGPTHPLKVPEVQRRAAVRAEARVRMEEAAARGDRSAALRLELQSLRVTPEMVAEARMVAGLLGSPSLVARHDGDALVASLARGPCQGVVSEDFDSLLWGSPRLLRHLAPFQTPETYDLTEVLIALGLTREQLVDAAIVAGTDFHPGVHGVGLKSAVQMLAKHGSLQAAAANASTVYEKRLAQGLSAVPLDELRHLFLDTVELPELPDQGRIVADADLVVAERFGVAPDVVPRVVTVL